MARNVRLREMLVGLEGLALLRQMYDVADAEVEQRLAEVRRLLDDETFSSHELIPEEDPRTGYCSWSGTYDVPGNPIVSLEQPAVWSLVEKLRPGRALDAACGTGRHARHLVKLGHEVVGFDFTPEMLAVAATNVPEATFVEADLREIPAEAQHFDLVVCGLALAHLPELDEPVAELARVLKPGGRLVVSVSHPFQAHLGWHALYTDPHGRRGFIREHPHSHADYIAAFRSAGLRMRDCLEPELTMDQVRAKRRAFRHIPEATAAAYLGLPGVLVWDAERPA
jgi:SAM-dependent methyltransferase